MEHALARLAVEPRLPVVVVLAVDDDATVFVMLNLIVAGWMTLVVLASKDDPRSAMRGWQTVCYHRQSLSWSYRLQRRQLRIESSPCRR
jgi:hypothetical protein